MQYGLSVQKATKSDLNGWINQPKPKQQFNQLILVICIFMEWKGKLFCKLHLLTMNSTQDIKKDSKMEDLKWKSKKMVFGWQYLIGRPVLWPVELVPRPNKDFVTHLKMGELLVLVNLLLPDCAILNHVLLMNIQITLRLKLSHLRSKCLESLIDPKDMKHV